MTHQTVRTMFVDALYGELTPADRTTFDEHLRGCPLCQQEYAELKGVSETMHKREREDLSPEDWKAFWNVLAATIDAQRSVAAPPPSRIRALVPRLAPSLRLAAAAAIIFFVGIGIGRFGLFPGDDAADPGRESRSTPVEQAALRAETMEYLERSKVLLLGIVNNDDIVPESGQLTRQREVSRMLVSAGAPLKDRLSRSGERQLGELVNDLEVLLLQITNLEIENDFPGLEIIRSGVDRKGILLKINVEQMKAQQERSRPPLRDESKQSRSMI